MIERSGLIFRIREHAVENSRPKKGKQPEFPDAFDSAETIHGIVSRFELSGRKGCVTAFASNHGRFFEAAARALTSDESTRRFWDQLAIAPDAFPPSQFEAIGEARVTAFDQMHRTHSIRWEDSNPSRETDFIDGTAS